MNQSTMFGGGKWGPWSEDEDDYLMACLEAGDTDLKDIAEYLGRTYKAVRQRGMILRKRNPELFSRSKSRPGVLEDWQIETIKRLGKEAPPKKILEAIGLPFNERERQRIASLKYYYFVRKPKAEAAKKAKEQKR